MPTLSALHMILWPNVVLRPHEVVVSLLRDLSRLIFPSSSIRTTYIWTLTPAQADVDSPRHVILRPDAVQASSPNWNSSFEIDVCGVEMMIWILVFSLFDSIRWRHKQNFLSSRFSPLILFFSYYLFQQRIYWIYKIMFYSNSEAR
jgi:hypothetical protein